MYVCDFFGEYILLLPFQFRVHLYSRAYIIFLQNLHSSSQFSSVRLLQCAAFSTLLLYNICSMQLCSVYSLQCKIFSPVI